MHNPARHFSPPLLHYVYMKIINTEQGSDEWLKMRLGKVTGTRLKSVMGTKKAREALIYELVAEQLSGVGEVLFQNDAMRWGTEHEDEAVKAWEKATGKKTQVVGFCISDEFPYLALSPDRLRGKTGAVEVKCPSTKVAIKYKADGGIPKEYLWQVVNYFVVNEKLKTLDFVVYDPRLKQWGLHVVTVTRKELEDEIAEAREALVEFRKEWEIIYNKVKSL